MKTQRIKDKKLDKKVEELKQFYWGIVYDPMRNLWGIHFGLLLKRTTETKKY